MMIATSTRLLTPAGGGSRVRCGDLFPAAGAMQPQPAQRRPLVT